MKAERTELYHRRHGEEETPPVLLLHGLGSQGVDWGLQLPALTRQFQPITVDLHGHGQSPSVEGWPTVADMAGDVQELLVRQSLTPVHAVGLSLGAAVALQLTLDYPGSVKSLAVVNGFARLRLGWRGLWTSGVRLLLLLAGRMDLLGRWVAHLLFPDPGMETLRRRAAARIAANDRSDYLRALWALRGFDVRHRLAEIGVPVLVISGAEDPIVPTDAKTELAEGLRSAETIKIDGSGHATPLDAAERFNQTLLAFLRSVERNEGGTPGGNS